MANVYVGTSGWMYRDWSFDYVQDKLNYFYPSKLPRNKWLEYFSRHFRTVEVNSTFYHQMKPAIFENWAQAVSDDFIFSIKASRFITHIKRLKDCRDSLKIMMEPTASLGEKLGPILFQCPPRWKADEKRLEDFLVNSSRLMVHSKGKSVNREPRTVNRLAFEFRDPSWFDESVYKILKKYKVALVIAESGDTPPSLKLRRARWPSEEVITADFVYIRFHGEGGSYSTKYTDKELAIWAKKIKKWQKDGIDVYAYFNNDVGGFAVENAKQLAVLIR